MTNFIKPMQPCNADLDLITFPCTAQKKWDGMKMVVKWNGDKLHFLKRSMKYVDNQWIIDQYTKALQPLVDNYVADPSKPNSFVIEGELQNDGLFEKCDGLVSASYREFDNIVYRVFDFITDINLDYNQRRKELFEAQGIINNPIVQMVGSAVFNDMDSLMDYHTLNDANPALDGTIVRQTTMPYKGGKRTAKQGHVVKIKDFLDDEATIVGFEELLSNQNEAKTNPLGRTERSTHKAGKIPMNTLGALVCRFERGKEPVEVKLGTGFSADLRKHIWDNRNDYVGSLAKFKYMRISKYGVPIHPVFLGFRDIGTLD